MNKILILLILFICQNALAEEFVLHADPKFIPDFKNRFSALVGINPSMTKTNQLKNVHLAYGKNKAENEWWDFNFTYTRGNFDKFTTNNPSATGTTNADLNSVSDSSNQIALGAGLLYETNYSQSLLPFNGMYELISASVTYNIFKDTQAGKTFTGPGLLAKFSVLKKFSDYLSIGGNFIYNLAVVKRSQDAYGETSSTRSLTLSHLTIGIDLSLYL